VRARTHRTPPDIAQIAGGRAGKYKIKPLALLHITIPYGMTSYMYSVRGSPCNKNGDTALTFHAMPMGRDVTCFMLRDRSRYYVELRALCPLRVYLPPAPWPRTCVTHAPRRGTYAHADARDPSVWSMHVV
jgi:hypothetical protein